MSVLQAFETQVQCPSRFLAFFQPLAQESLAIWQTVVTSAHWTFGSNRRVERIDRGMFSYLSSNVLSCRWGPCFPVGHIICVIHTECLLTEEG
ncbi:hypothetical protein T03_3538 [Trichinella britovi]|uniref:Uncharacterized protein n=1 Tax=Trichinella britovi TaxID=45882 RepID=A0A0V1B7B9_TRIBR|nr:hypothetical protein T03_3538 [Trichinella britovi]